MFCPGFLSWLAHFRQADRAGSSGDAVPQTVSLKPDGGALVGGDSGAERLA
jgi:hypothetical protein